jgi:hypothetical protein
LKFSQLIKIADGANENIKTIPFTQTYVTSMNVANPIEHSGACWSKSG